MKRIAVGALLLDASRRILIVKPVYRPEWLIPGGVVEERESPRAACARELHEELGLTLELRRLLCLEYSSTSSVGSEALHLIFLARTLGAEDIARIRLPRGELAEYRLSEMTEAMRLLAPRLARRVALATSALTTGRVTYAEDGESYDD